MMMSVSSSTTTRRRRSSSCSKEQYWQKQLPSMLQRKGLITLLLLILTESISVINAVRITAATSAGGAATGRQGIVSTDASSSSSSSSSGRSVEDDDCSGDGTCNMLTKEQEEYCEENCPDYCIGAGIINKIPRGGNIAAEAATETIKAAASSSSKSAVTPYGIPLNGWKVLFQIFLTSLNVFFWRVPLENKSMTDNKFILGLANAFSGGVFLSLAFGHLIPECVHGFADIGNEVLPYMTVLGGYLLIFFVEKVAFDTDGALHQMQEGGGGNSGSDNEKAVVTNGDASDNKSSNASSRGAVILLGALAVHSVLEMTALGLADSFSDSALLTMSIALHQPAESIALLVAFLKSGLTKNQIIQYLSIFSACGPIGVAIGMAVNEFASPIIDCIMLALVAGTFIYVGATEVIPEEWEDTEDKWIKFVSLLSGIISIFFITQYTMTLEVG